MENWNIIQALCRCAIATKSDAAIHQVDRLLEAITSQGYANEAEELHNMLKNETGTMEPKIVQSASLERTMLYYNVIEKCVCRDCKCVFPDTELKREFKESYRTHNGVCIDASSHCPKCNSSKIDFPERKKLSYHSH